MPIKINKDSFIEKSVKIHRDKYDYSLVEYVDRNTKVNILCKKHGMFSQLPKWHIRGSGCGKCGRYDSQNKQKMPLDRLLEKFKEKHGDSYDYSLVEYYNESTKIKIVCKLHGIFEQSPRNHKNGGCYQCRNIKLSLTLEEFVERSNVVHNYKYNYSKSKYDLSKRKILIICPEHGEFYQIPQIHMRGGKCRECDKLERRMKIEEFLKIAKDIYGDLYDYSLTKMVNADQKCLIICPNHGQFYRTRKSFLAGSGCPKCGGTVGESKIKRYLDFEKINYEAEVSFKECSYKRLLRFDFCVNINHKIYLIEYQGKQHYQAEDFFEDHKKNEQNFELIKIRDRIKRDYCQKNNIPLLEIPYWEENWENLISEFLYLNSHTDKEQGNL